MENHGELDWSDEENLIDKNSFGNSFY